MQELLRSVQSRLIAEIGTVSGLSVESKRDVAGTMDRVLAEVKTSLAKTVLDASEAVRTEVAKQTGSVLTHLSVTTDAAISTLAEETKRVHSEVSTSNSQLTKALSTHAKDTIDALRDVDLRARQRHESATAARQAERAADAAAKEKELAAQAREREEELRARKEAERQMLQSFEATRAEERQALARMLAQTGLDNRQQIADVANTAVEIKESLASLSGVLADVQEDNEKRALLHNRSVGDLCVNLQKEIKDQLSRTEEERRRHYELTAQRGADMHRETLVAVAAVDKAVKEAVGTISVTRKDLLDALETTDKAVGETSQFLSTHAADTGNALKGLLRALAKDSEDRKAATERMGDRLITSVNKVSTDIRSEIKTVAEAVNDLSGDISSHLPTSVATAVRDGLATDHQHLVDAVARVERSVGAAPQHIVSSVATGMDALLQKVDARLAHSAEKTASLSSLVSHETATIKEELKTLSDTLPETLKYETGSVKETVAKVSCLSAYPLLLFSPSLFTCLLYLLHPMTYFHHTAYVLVLHMSCFLFPDFLLPGHPRIG